MTLALLEDSGWYRANYSMADHLEWGRNQGTEFFTSPCNQWKGAYHSNSTQFSGCTYNREPEGYCPIVSYNGDLPQWAQYFPQPKKGGQSSLADYCTYFLAYSDGSCTDINSARAPNMMLGEVRGSDSRCMASSLVRSGFVRGSTTQGNGCYQHRCLNNSLEGSRVKTVASVLARTTVVATASASKMVFVAMKMDTRASTAQQSFVTSIVAYMAVCATMGFVSSRARTMPDTAASTPQQLSFRHSLSAGKSSRLPEKIVLRQTPPFFLRFHGANSWSGLHGLIAEVKKASPSR